MQLTAGTENCFIGNERISVMHRENPYFSAKYPTTFCISPIFQNFPKKIPEIVSWPSNQFSRWRFFKVSIRSFSPRWIRLEILNRQLSFDIVRCEPSVSLNWTSSTVRRSCSTLSVGERASSSELWPSSTCNLVVNLCRCICERRSIPGRRRVHHKIF